jgi:glycosyltransferase involved in cell wall biosynthesis
VRIAFISASKIPSRTANSIQVMKVCNAFCALNHQVALWVPGSNPRVKWDDLKSLYGIDHDFPIHWLRSINVFKKYDFALRTIFAAKLSGADLVYVWPLQAAALASKLNLPTLLEAHDRPRGRLGPSLMRWYLSGGGAIRLLPITAALRQWLAEFYRVELVEPFAPVAPMGVDLKLYENLPDPTEARGHLGLPEGFTAGYTGHLYPGRGLELLYQVAHRNPGIMFLWVGGEKNAVDAWRERALKDGIDNLHIHGFVPNEELPLFQAACDVLLMPYESRVSVSSGANTAAFASPMKVFEYLAAGRAILSSDLPVLLEILDSTNSVILPMDDIEAWSHELQGLMVDPSRRETLAEHARADVYQYSWIERAKRSIQDL